MKVNRKVRRERWWQYGERAPNLYETISGISQVLLVAQTSKTLAFAMVPTGCVFSLMTIVFALPEFTFFSLMQSNLHSCWAWKYGSTMKSDLRYTPSDIFETFRFPPSASSSSIGDDLERIGERYHEHRRELMLKLQLGLTKTYNLFH